MLSYSTYQQTILKIRTLHPSVRLQFHQLRATTGLVCEFHGVSFSLHKSRRRHKSWRRHKFLRRPHDSSFRGNGQILRLEPATEQLLIGSCER